jgi:hypothetical protein
VLLDEISVQEMLHLALVCKSGVGIGGASGFNRPTPILRDAFLGQSYASGQPDGLTAHNLG